MSWQELDTDERYVLDGLIAEQMDAFAVIRQQRYVEYESASARDYPSVAQLAWIRLCRKRWPCIELWPLRAGRAQGVAFSATAPDGRILTSAGVRAIFAIMAPEAAKRSHSFGYQWELRPTGLFIEHAPRASIAPLVRKLWPILSDMTEAHSWDRRGRIATDARWQEIYAVRGFAVASAKGGAE